MQMFKREVVQSLFYETLGEFVKTSLTAFNPQPKYLPIPSREDLEVDWRFPVQNGKDIYLFGVKDTSKARLAALTCLEYQKARVPFRSVMVHEDFESGLSKKDRTRLTNVADKQFTTFSEFAADAGSYLSREANSTSIQ